MTAFLLIRSTGIVSAQEAYFDENNHYSFSLPSGWRDIPKSIIDEYVDEIVKQTQGKRVEYLTGFQLSEKDYFQYPYILIQKHDINTPSYLQIEKIFDGNNIQDSLQKSTDKYSELMISATIDKPFIDKERNIIFINMQMDVVGVGEITGLMAIFLGKQEIIQLNFYTVSSEYSRWLPVFNSIIGSFKYADDYAYDSVDTVKNDSPSIFDNVIEKGLFGLVAGGLVVFIVSLYYKGRRDE